MYQWVSYVGVPFTGIYYNWQYLRSLVVRIPVSNPSAKAYSLVENAKKWEIGCLFYTQVHNSLIFVDALNQG